MEAHRAPERFDSLKAAGSRAYFGHSTALSTSTQRASPECGQSVPNVGCERELIRRSVGPSVDDGRAKRSFDLSRPGDAIHQTDTFLYQPSTIRVLDKTNRLYKGAIGTQSMTELC